MPSLTTTQRSIRFSLPDGATFRITQKQLDEYLDKDPDTWYAMLDYAEWEPTEPKETKAMPKKPAKIITVNATPVTPTVDWDAEWAEVAKMFDEFYATPVEKPVKRVTNAKKHPVSRSTLDSKARVLEYIPINGDYTVSKFRTAWKHSVYAQFADDITELKLNKAESWDALWQAIKDYDSMDANFKAAAKYENRVQRMKVAELKAECKNLGLTGYSKLKKDELIEFILDSQKAM